MKRKPYSKKVEYNGIIFDSTLELRFALLIEDKCEYIYHPLTIWYDKNNLTKQGKQTCPHKYEPDFLVRKIGDNSAHLIEIKAQSFLNAESVKTKEFIAKRYIESKGPDWNYKILTDRNIHLNQEKQAKLKEILQTRKYLKPKQNLIHKEAKMLNQWVHKNDVPMKTVFGLEVEDHRLFVRKGLMREYVS